MIEVTGVINGGVGAGKTLTLVQLYRYASRIGLGLGRPANGRLKEAIDRIYHGRTPQPSPLLTDPTIGALPSLRAPDSMVERAVFVRLGSHALAGCAYTFVAPPGEEQCQVVAHRKGMLDDLTRSVHGPNSSVVLLECVDGIRADFEVGAEIFLRIIEKQTKDYLKIPHFASTVGRHSALGAAIRCASMVCFDHDLDQMAAAASHSPFEPDDQIDLQTREPARDADETASSASAYSFLDAIPTDARLEYRQGVYVVTGADERTEERVLSSLRVIALAHCKKYIENDLPMSKARLAVAQRRLVIFTKCDLHELVGLVPRNALRGVLSELTNGRPLHGDEVAYLTVTSVVLNPRPVLNSPAAQLRDLNIDVPAESEASKIESLRPLVATMDAQATHHRELRSSRLPKAVAAGFAALPWLFLAALLLVVMVLPFGSFSGGAWRLLAIVPVGFVALVGYRWLSAPSLAASRT
ncbi:MAG TPA: hypothetical protein VHC22_24085 [Pirellulales bacterium]|nr:hypothetical protein [Pirellulales bacterium]